jgi:hypothetical protein
MLYNVRALKVVVYEKVVAAWSNHPVPFMKGRTPGATVTVNV